VSVFILLRAVTQPQAVMFSGNPWGKVRTASTNSLISRSKSEPTWFHQIHALFVVL
jgi:hypothetical protein